MREDVGLHKNGSIYMNWCYTLGLCFKDLYEKDNEIVFKNM